ncbi:uncharacterized protein LOC115878562 [Sitophilus oryzae]|uniref:Uncharacterized protein LOC115878562 n=1 Tax=Sitophilus oryzae TaxID=7048 RepID=A0A6J2XJ58_SITOR|nr:uncharacterized protein LOC115878562 [Sitophilus oryzae]
MYLILYLLTIIYNIVIGTIDLNTAELQYLADHLTPEECRRLVAAAHFHGFEEPNALDKADRKVPKDILCIDHLHHWNAQQGEGKGETHEVLEHRLRQMGKTELADWLGKIVFRQLGIDLENAINKEIIDYTEKLSTESAILALEPLQPKIENPTEYNIIDTFLYALAIGISLTIIGLSVKLICNKISKNLKQRKRRKLQYEFMDADTSDSEHEDNKFDIRTYISSSHITR